jgi:ABC-type uncharacterized transport system substrate-binding protein
MDGNSRLIFNIVLLAILVTACSTTAKPTETVAEITSTQELGLMSESPLVYSGKKVLWVNSYHSGFEWTDGIEAGIQSVLKDTSVEFRVYEMDTKRNIEQAFKVEAGKQAMAVVEEFKPDVVIACDDNAQEFFVVPFLKDTGLPVVFCGVNWDASMYGYPSSNVTGMLEVDPAIVLVKHLRQYASGDRVGFLAHNDETNHKVTAFWNENFFDGQMKAYLVSDFEEYKTSFLKAQEEVDMLVLIALPEWDEDAVQMFLKENVQIPTGAIDTFMAPYVLIAVAKVPEEQGEWAARTALQILDGISPSDIPIVTNQKGKLFLNLEIAERLDVVFTLDLIRNAEIVDK